MGTGTSGIAAIAMVLGNLGAQIGVLSFPTTNVDLRSVVVTGGGHVVICNHYNGEQFVVDVSVPTAPQLVATIDPPFGDQWYEAEFTTDFGGRMFTGHRFGGLNMLDVSIPTTPTIAASAATIYHYRGMRYRNVGGQGVLYYNEHNWGLAAFSVGPQSLTQVFTDFNNANSDANGMALVGNYLYSAGKPFNRPTTRELKVYDVSNPTAPILVNTVVSPGDPVTAGHCQLRETPFGDGMFAARNDDGLDWIDLSVPTAPVVVPLLTGNAALRCWGSYPVPGTAEVYVYGSLGIGAGAVGWLVSCVAAPGALLPQSGAFSPFIIRDMASDANGRIYLVGFSDNTPSRVPQLWVF